MPQLPSLAGALPVPPAAAVAAARSESPRERLLHSGSSALSDAELVAVCLRTGGAGYSAVGLARHLLEVVGGVHRLAALPPQRLLAIPGLGPAKVATLFAALEICQRAAAAGLSRERVLDDAAAALAYVRSAIGSRDREVFGCLFLDARHRPLAFEELFHGSIDRAHVHPRIVLKRALTHNAGAVILTHNHPSGVCEPSASDIRLTTQLRELLLQIDVRVVDHLIVTGTDGVSMAQLGLLSD